VFIFSYVPLFSNGYARTKTDATWRKIPLKPPIRRETRSCKIEAAANFSCAQRTNFPDHAVVLLQSKSVLGVAGKT